MALVHHYFDDILNDGNHELIDDIIHPAYIPFPDIKDPKAIDGDTMKEQLMKITGVEGIKSRIKLFSEQFGKINFQMVDVVETNETIVVHYKITMTHIGTWNEIPATGLEISTFGFHLFKFKDDKIFSISGMLNMTEFLSQLGNAIISQKNELPDYVEIMRKLLNL